MEKEFDFVYFFNNEILGHEPSEQDNSITKATVEYLADCGLSKEEILNAILHSETAKEHLSKESLPDELWNGSLISRGKFYYHHALQLIPHFKVDPITLKSVSTSFYLENKIRFTMKDLILYFYKTLGIDPKLMDERKDAGAFNSMLNECKRKFDFIEPLDFVLALIDLTKNENTKAYEPFDIKRDGSMIRLCDILQRKINEAKFYKRDREIPRCKYQQP